MPPKKKALRGRACNQKILNETSNTAELTPAASIVLDPKEILDLEVGTKDNSQNIWVEPCNANFLSDDDQGL